MPHTAPVHVSIHDVFFNSKFFKQTASLIFWSSHYPLQFTLNNICFVVKFLLSSVKLRFAQLKPKSHPALSGLNVFLFILTDTC